MPNASAALIRPARVTDAGALSELFGQLGYPTSTEEVRARLETRCGAGNALCLVAEQDGVVGGVIVMHLLEPLHVAGRWALVSSLVVREALRGFGVGAALLAEVERLAWEAGCSHVELSSSEKRTRAHAFYERQGFEEVRKRLVKRRPSPC
jgi:GNAT superfamily N-acetyltransferase